MKFADYLNQEFDQLLPTLGTLFTAREVIVKMRKQTDHFLKRKDVLDVLKDRKDLRLYTINGSTGFKRI